MDYGAFRVVNDLAGRTARLDRAMMLTAEYAPLLFVRASLRLWATSSVEPRALQNRLGAGRA